MSAARGSLAVLPPGEVEEDRLEPRRETRRVAHRQAELGCGLHELDEDAFRARRVHTDERVVPLDLDRANRIEPLRALGEWRGIALDGHGDQRLGAVPALQLRRRVDGERLAAIENRDALAEYVRLLHVVRREQRRLPGAVEVREDPPEIDPGLRVDAGGRLVEEQHLRRVHQRAGQHQPLRETTREAEDHRVGPLGERELLEQVVGARSSAGAGNAEEAAVVVEVLPDRERPVERVRLRDHADLALHVGGVPPHVEAGDERTSSGRDHRGGQHPDRGRLARAVGAEEPEELAAPHLEVEPVGGYEGAVPVVELVGPDRRVPHRRERICTAGTTMRSPGGVPERPKGTGCKPVGSAYGGSNPPAPTLTSERQEGDSVIVATRSWISRASWSS